MRAIEFGEMDDLRAVHPDAVSELPCTEPAATTTPNILIGAQPAGPCSRTSTRSFCKRECCWGDRCGRPFC